MRQCRIQLRSHAGDCAAEIALDGWWCRLEARMRGWMLRRPMSLPVPRSQLQLLRETRARGTSRQPGVGRLNDHLGSQHRAGRCHGSRRHREMIRRATRHHASPHDRRQLRRGWLPIRRA